jgi:protein-S-isoprenylcysteine O-methyltransferase Ste14
LAGVGVHRRLYWRVFRDHGALLLVIGIALALGSWWGLLAVVVMVPALVWRLLDEERFLRKNLPGYDDYSNHIRYRLVPFVY